jgi:hypothetical protein
LRAAALDEDIAAELRAGTLTVDHEAPPFGLEGMTAAAPRSKHPKQPKQTAEERRTRAEAERLQERAERLEAAAVEAERRAAQARAAADEARRSAEEFGGH